MNIEVFTFNPIQENTYLLSDDRGRALIIDPGNSTATEDRCLQQAIDSAGLKLECIVCTHLHFDHIMGINFLQEKYHCDFYAHRQEEYWLRNISGMAAAFGVDVATRQLRLEKTLKDGDEIQIGDMRLEVLGTPGHSAGGLCFYAPAQQALFCGDSLFAGSIGRTDLPGGDLGTLISSIHDKLLCLPDETVIYPGHGPDSSIGQEKRMNPYLQYQR
ncbi:MAG: MBL fold metallo-hydrolase [Bacteroidales bacterium]|nr:MBL fold metallo-hydrolase [Bacteroidales bacterium]